MKAQTDADRPEAAAAASGGRGDDWDDDPGRSKVGAPQPEQAARPQQFQQVNIAFGTTPTGHEHAAGRLTGRLDESDIAATLACFIEPVPYDSALAILDADRVVVLHGPPGIGKRTGAISLLRDVIGCRLRALSPALTLEELTQREYHAGHGYLVTYGSIPQNLADADFTWRKVRERVRDCGSSLVVTMPASQHRLSDAVRRIAWTQPDLARLFFAHFADRWTDEADPRARVDELKAALPSTYAMCDLIEFIAGIDADDEAEAFSAKVAAAREKVFGEAARADVREWFDAEVARSRREVAGATVLAFLDKPPRRDFWTGLSYFEEELDRTMPVPQRELGPSTSADEALAQGGRDLLAGLGLMTTERETYGEVSRQVLTFRADRHRELVLAELWQRMDARFWEAVRGWLCGTVAAGGGDPAYRRRRAVARALAMLAEHAFDEVQYAFLDRWARNQQGWGGTITAAFTLSEMSLSDALAPAALRIALRWTVDGNSDQRWTAAIALTDRLGARYPEEAAELLWLLVIGEDYEWAELAMARLFADLIPTPDAVLVLDLLARMHDEVAAESLLRSKALSTIAAVLSVVEHPSGQLAMLGYLRRYPERLDTVVRLLVLALRSRSQRKVLLDALLYGLSSADGAQELAGPLGNALARAFSPYERRPFEHNFVARKRYRDRTDPPAPEDVERIDEIVRIFLKPFTRNSIERIN